MAIFSNKFSLRKSSLIYLFVWILVLLYNPILHKTISVAEIGMSLLFILVATFAGVSILIHSNIFTDRFIFWPVSIFVGSLIIGTFIIFIPSSFVIPVLLLITAGSIAILFFTTQNVDKNKSEPLFPIIWLVPAFTIILIHQFTGTDYIEAQSLIPFQGKDALPDSFFFTLVAESYSHFGHSNSFFDYGANLMYQPIAFYPPAALTKFSGIPAQVTLWGIWMPFYKIATPIVICYGIIKHFVKEQKNAGWIFLLSILLLYSLAPINPKYILSLELEKIVWLGTGYLLPGGNPPFTAALLLGGVVMYIFFSKEKCSVIDQILLVILIALLINTKIAFYIPFGIFIGIIAIFKYYHNSDKQRLILLLLSIIPALIFYLFPLNSAEDNLSHFSFNPGFYLHYFMSLTGVSSFNKGLIIMTGTLALWGGIRFLIMFLGLKTNFKETNPYVIAALISLTGSILLPSLLTLKLIAPDGELLQNLTFDLVQFVRGAFFITTIASLIIIFSQWKNFFSKKWITTSLVLFSVLVISSNVTRYIISNTTEDDQTWRNEVRKELKSVNKTGLYAIKGTRKYSGQLLAAEGFGPWWFTTKRGDGSGYIMNNKNYYRAVAMDSLLSGNNPSQIIDLMKKENVQLIVATPDTKNVMDKLKNLQYIHQKPNDNWIYRLQ